LENRPLRSVSVWLAALEKTVVELAIIGAGRLGTSLGRALAAKGHRVRALTCRRLASVRESRRIIGQGKALTDNPEAAGRADVIFLCLPDRQIKKTAAALSRAHIDWTPKLVFHTSGLLAADVLGPLREKGARVAAFHPVQSFPSKKTPASRFRGIFFGLEGDPEAVSLAKNLIKQLGGRVQIVPREARPLYHAACSLASNDFVILLDAAARLLTESGLKEKEPLEMLLPLVEGTLQNVKIFDVSAALTGPVIRGDRATVQAHLDALNSHPLLCEVHKTLGRLALEIAKKRGLSPLKIRALKNLLGDK
jgi:predicted short-subunit dehydrogenase-like oxidoreductase (DUF2520 family)